MTHHHHHAHYPGGHPGHSLIGAAPRGYSSPPGGPVATLHPHPPPPPVHTAHYTTHHQLSQQVKSLFTNYNLKKIAETFIISFLSFFFFFFFIYENSEMLNSRN